MASLVLHWPGLGGDLGRVWVMCRQGSPAPTLLSTYLNKGDTKGAPGPAGAPL